MVFSLVKLICVLFCFVVFCVGIVFRRTCGSSGAQLRGWYHVRKLSGFRPDDFALID